ncbi:MAG: class I SAM-dependent methyltransferase, partial [Desulfobaccales bacterium]
MKDHGLKPEHYLMDIGCGTLRGGIPLIDYLKEGHYFGIETRKEVLDEGRMELKEAGLNWKSPTLLTTEQFTKGGILQKFDFIWAFSVLIHMTDEILNDTL